LSAPATRRQDLLSAAGFGVVEIEYRLDSLARTTDLLLLHLIELRLAVVRGELDELVASQFALQETESWRSDCAELLRSPKFNENLSVAYRIGPCRTTRPQVSPAGQDAANFQKLRRLTT
jgi:hypothetical protein